jgi:hypothetical protein
VGRQKQQGIDRSGGALYYPYGGLFTADSDHFRNGGKKIAGEPTMKIIFLISVFSIATAGLQAQDDVFSSSSTERDTIFSAVPEQMMSAGAFGGMAFISPDRMNDIIEFNNSLYNDSESPIANSVQGGLWILFRPKNLPTYFTLRAEMLTTTKAFSFTTPVTLTSSTVISNNPSTLKYRYSLYPFSIGTGTVVYKTIAKFEIAFVYALATISQTTSIEQLGETSTTYDGSGYGFRLNFQQVVPIVETIGLTFEVGYRYLTIDQFRDARGTLVKNVSMNYSGMNVAAGASYGF